MSIDNSLACAICLEEITESPLTMSCNHTFCVNCMGKYYDSTLNEEIKNYVINSNYDNDDDFFANEMKDFSSSISKVNAKCPLCRQNLPANLYQYLYEKICEYIKLGNELVLNNSHVSDEDDIQSRHYANLAQLEYDKLTLFKLQTQKNIVNINILLRSLLPKIKRLNCEYALASVQANDIIHEIINSNTQNLYESTLIDMYLNVGWCYIKLNKFNEAIGIYRQIYQLIINHDHKYMHIQRTITYKLCQCLYYVGEYSDAIKFGEDAVDRNRHYEDVYTYIIRSYVACNDYPNAIITMKRSCRYESPWSSQQKDKLQLRLIKLEKEFELFQTEKLLLKSKFNNLINLDAILFDVDGTLSDSFELCFSSTNIILENNNYHKITEEEYHLGTKFCTTKRLANHATGDPDHEIGHKLGKEFDDLYIKLVSIKTCPFYPNMNDLLNNISKKKKNILFGAISNASGSYVRSCLEANDCLDLFNCHLGVDDVSSPKPSPDGLLQCCNDISVNPSNCIYIGDSPSDGLAAKKCHMASIGVTYGSHPIESISQSFDYCVNNVDELQELLLKLVTY
jgi:HAD superfamily hydrolase (TIGR01509 family)